VCDSAHRPAAPTDADLNAIEAELWRLIRDDAAAAERDIEDTHNRHQA
jgi:hypothetical protein